MKVLEVGKLRAGDRILFPWCHENGRVLLPAGCVLDDAHLTGMGQAGIQLVFECESDDDLRTLRNEAGRTARKLDELPLDQPLSVPIYDTDGCLLLRAETVLTEAQVRHLRKRGLEKVYLEPRLSSAPSEAVERFRGALLVERARQLDDRAQRGDALSVSPRGPAFRARDVDPARDYTEEEKAAVRVVREETVQNVDHIFRSAAEGSGIGPGAAGDCVDRLLEGFAKAPNLLECLTYLEEKDDFLAQHAVSTAAVAMAMGESLRFSQEQVRELALAALLANVGMVKVPDPIVRKPDRLTPDEMREIQRHPIHGINLLEQFGGVPETVRLAIYQSHERDDGTGYPRHRKRTQIHDYARVLVVADMFVAMSSARYHRPALLPYEAIESTVRLAGSGAVCPKTVRALLQAVSLYPIGSWVELNTGQAARVVSAGGQRPIDRPVVRILLDPFGEPTTPRVIDLSKETSVRVVRAMPCPIAGADKLVAF